MTADGVLFRRSRCSWKTRFSLSFCDQPVWELCVHMHQCAYGYVCMCVCVVCGTCLCEWQLWCWGHCSQGKQLVAGAYLPVKLGPNTTRVYRYFRKRKMLLGFLYGLIPLLPSPCSCIFTWFFPELFKRAGWLPLIWNALLLLVQEDHSFWFCNFCKLFLGQIFGMALGF